ncbi:efflux RND transporter periplasmic adaptor subunit [Streptomyces sp. NPDC001100]
MRTQDDSTARSELSAPDPLPALPRRHRRARWAITAVLLTAIAGGVGYAAIARQAPASTVADKPQPETDKVTRQTLVNTKQVDGTLGYAGSTAVTGQLAGTITALPGVGDTIRRGEELFQVDGTPVLLMYGKAPAYRDLKVGEKGDDVRQLERNLQALGYGGFTVDNTFTAATAQAVKRWQEHLGLPKTGTVAKGRVVFSGGELRVGEHKAAVGSVAQPGAEVFTATSIKRQVHVDLDIADQALAKKNEQVTVTLPNGKTVSGTITSIGKTVTKKPGADGSGDKYTVAVDILLDAAGAPNIVQAPVTVGLKSDTKKNVLTVPVTALLALSEGGYGVQAVGTDGESTVVPVKLGMFANGRVEVSGTGLTAGMTVETAA